MENLNFLPLEKSDEIQHRSAHSFPPRQELKRNAGAYPFFRQLLSNLSYSHPLLPDDADDVFLSLDPESDTTGVLQLSTARINSGWRRLLAFRPDGFTLVDARFSNKCVVDMNTDEVPGQNLMDIAAWGPRWSEFIRAAR